MDNRFRRRDLLMGATVASVGWSMPVWAETKANILPQPFFASIKRVLAALSAIGQPISSQDAARLKELARRGDVESAEAADSILSKYALANVALRSDGYAQTTIGARAAEAD